MTAWTARIAVGLYFAALVAARRSPHGQRSKWFIHLWAIACGMLLVHVLAAFYEVHHWSWQQAVEHTSRETKRVVGRASGIELWANIVFLGGWLYDAAQRLRGTPRLITGHYERCVQTAWAVMFFNATVVFGPPFWRYLIPAAVLIVATVRQQPHCGTLSS